MTNKRNEVGWARRAMQRPNTIDRPCARVHDPVTEVRAIARSCSSTPSQSHQCGFAAISSSRRHAPYSYPRAASIPEECHADLPIPLREVRQNVRERRASRRTCIGSSALPSLRKRTGSTRTDAIFREDVKKELIQAVEAIFPFARR